MRSTPLPVLALALVILGGCRPKELEHPRDEKTLLARSAIAPEADRLIDALMHHRIKDLHAWMTPGLQGQVRLGDLSATSQRLRDGYGEPIGILEERTHQEGTLH